MNNPKGMSQTLALIVAASVLMMTALTVIFLAQGVLGDFGEDSTISSCERTVASQCQAVLTSTGGSKTINTPAVCINDEGDRVVTEVGEHQVGTEETICNAGAGNRGDNEDAPSYSVTPEGCPNGWETCPTG